MKPFNKIIILNIVFALIVSILIGALISKNYNNRINQRFDTTKEIINLKIDTFISESNSISESLTTILSNSNDEKFINQFLKDNHTRYTWIDHIYILNNKNQIVYDSKGPNYTSIEDFNQYKYHFPFTQKSTLSSKKRSLDRPKTLLLTNRLKIKNQDYTVAAEINMNSFKNEIKLIAKRFQIQVQGIDGTQIYQVGKSHKHTKTITYFYNNLPVTISITGQYSVITRVILPSIFIFLVIFLILTILTLIFKSRSDRLEHEKLIEQANNEKLRLIGTLAANTAHEIKNPLTSINGFIELTRMKYDQNQQDNHFNIITEELDRINNIVTQFLYLGKPTNLAYTNVNISQTIKDIEQFSKYELEQNNINISLSLPEEPIYAFLSEDQLKQILINLIQNSKDALTDVHNASIEIQLLKTNTKQIKLVFKDNGKGMSKEVQQKVFDPFFTIKDSGSGLGLYLSKKLIEDWGGTISVANNTEGTTFIIMIPVVKHI
ncbi:ATP-binding protein [Mammaliicoccus fleurettii]|uniref:ATP-binding protein n=1 Tax=Mammaliicoccus fleurettii TaxID=150056 RepID=UPI000E02C96A|nr:ATP-binding protein [Mammaliicoccus fleurettii]RTX85588.1 two-component sensor histidine kinase [Mammaliicoccus fleurettii]SUM37151.1 respiratory response protein SrrB [Mammaliicoccus fleurettii]HCN60066.1 two-component sensor histidine kinase [Staphylococcus sp.]